MSYALNAEQLRQQFATRVSLWDPRSKTAMSQERPAGYVSALGGWLYDPERD